MNFISTVFLLSATCSALSLRGMPQRQLAVPYYKTTDINVLGPVNMEAAMDNPLKGLLTSPRWTGGSTPDAVPSTLEFFYLGLDEVLTGPGLYNWGVLDDSLTKAESLSKHVIWRIFIHYPGQPLRLPQFLVDSVQMVDSSEGRSPNYDDPVLLAELEKFIAALGERYDGHKSLGFLQLGLLGYWGEWHTYGTNNILSQSTMDKVVEWYDAAFDITPLQTRYPLQSATDRGMGLHDDSFGFSTLDGSANGGISSDWFFWPRVQREGSTTFWQRGVMGGETRPELQGEIFKAGYQTGTEYKQDFFKCVDVTHATYMFHHNAFKNGGYTGSELATARRAHAYMGYNFQVTGVAATSTSNGVVSVDVTVKQTGVAPFYYPLSLQLTCPGTTETVNGVEELISNGDSKSFTFLNIPADSCLDNIEISLVSDHVHAGRPVKFAQANGRVSIALPKPTQDRTNELAPAPVTAPELAPVPAPISAPESAPVQAPADDSWQSGDWWSAFLKWVAFWKN